MRARRGKPVSASAITILLDETRPRQRGPRANLPRHRQPGAGCLPPRRGSAFRRPERRVGTDGRSERLRIELLQTKGELERELGRLLLHCRQCNRRVHWVPGVGADPARSWAQCQEGFNEGKELEAGLLLSCSPHVG
jgi:hypothetical protein